jgi:hypothetical protein
VKRVILGIALVAALASVSLAQGPRKRPDQYWNATPNDVNNLLKSMKGMIGVSYNMQIASLNEIDTDPTKNPILYRSGHFNYSYTDEQRKKLREYMLAGGMVIYNTSLGGHLSRATGAAVDGRSSDLPCLLRCGPRQVHARRQEGRICRG